MGYSIAVLLYFSAPANINESYTCVPKLDSVPSSFMSKVLGSELNTDCMKSIVRSSSVAEFLN